MDLNEMKNRAKDLLADLTDNRPEREERRGRADDAVDPAARTDRLEPQRPATDPHDADPRDAELRESELRDPELRESELRDPELRESDRRDPEYRDPEFQEPGGRRPDVHERDAREPDLRDPDLRDTVPPPAEPRDQPGASPRTAAEPDVVAPPVERHLDPAPVPVEQPDGPGRHHLRDSAAPDAVDADGLPADPDRLVTADRAQSYGARWDEVKGEFVDEPRRAVVRADALVGELLDELSQLFTQQRRGIEQDLDNDEVSTEDLRVALRRYRSFFDRLLSV